MPYAVTHVLTAIILIDLFRKKVLKKKQFPLYLVLLGGLAGLLPDIDVLIYWIIQAFTDLTFQEVHRSFTHTFIPPLAILLIALLLRKWPKISHSAFVISAGWTIHVLLDSIFTDSPIFFPFTSQEFGLHLVEFISPNIAGTFYMGLDAIILLLWLAYEWKTKNIKDYI